MAGNRPRRPHVGVLGIGNILMGDDAVGPIVAASLATRTWPANVEIRDLGAPGLDLGSYLYDLDAALFVDAAELGTPAGTVRRILRDDLLGVMRSPRVSPHDPNLAQALRLVEMERDATIDVALIGVQPESTELGAPLSPAVSGALPAVERAVMDWLAERGVEPVTKEIRS